MNPRTREAWLISNSPDDPHTVHSEAGKSTMPPKTDIQFICELGENKRRLRTNFFRKPLAFCVGVACSNSHVGKTIILLHAFNAVKTTYHAA